MKQTIVIVGHSPLSYFLARELNKRLGSLAHTNLVWLGDSAGVVHLSTTASLLDKRHHALPKPRFSDLRVRSEDVKSINLSARRIITAKTVIDYDRLVLDQVPSYTMADLAAISQELLTLLSGLQAHRLKLKAGSTRVYCQGESVESWQLALAIRRDLHRHYASIVGAVQVLIDLPGNHAGDFLRRNGLIKATPATLRLPGITIKQSAAAITTKKVKGLQLGRDGSALVDASLSPPGFPEVTIFNAASFRKVNLLRVFHSLARQYANQLVASLDEEAGALLQIPAAAMLLKSHGGSYLLLGELENRRTRARLVAGLDQQLRRRLKS